MAGKVLNYYAGGNTARGFHSLFESNLQHLDRLFILKGGPGTGKSSIMKKVGAEWLEKGYTIEYIHCSSDNNSIDGVIIPKLKAGIVDGTAPHVIEPKVPGAIENYINLGEAWDADVLSVQKKEIQKHTNNISKAFESAYAVFKEALKIHDDWEKIYIENMDFEKANKLTGSLLEAFFGNIVLNKKSIVKHRFLGAATPQGAVDFVQNLTEDVPKRYFIKGRPGSGKSTLLKKIAAKAEETGFDAEVYHCGFDPNSLDMVIIRELGICIFDSTAPHEYFPSREGDEIIDMYKSIIEPSTDEIFADKIEALSKQYRFKMKEATSYLKLAKSLHDELEKIYVQAMDFSKVDRLTEKISIEFKRMAEITV
ncbi:PRK06851 family protein [Bacillus methanolicus]|uniref:ATPase n=1 Tax=Bacillus methanolicus (strain MGA3 / ATCC 53907) TaxID=796606 RepID=I3EBS4_BACMM|nr:PRK06851 family protein [Bacillus methanolicus]AIE61625.1 ATPase [Bacillus methanolicus MGA3]EIJ83945.1 hypothetical protein MGA3_01595 [Bacillus methanolicus MGA3]